MRISEEKCVAVIAFWGTFRVPHLVSTIVDVAKGLALHRKSLRNLRDSKTALRCK